MERNPISAACFRIGFLRTVLVSVALLVSFSACKAKPQQERGSEELPTVRVGYIPVTHCLPLFAASDRGLFQAEGVRVELVSLAGGAKILEALIAEDLDIGFSNVVSALLARGQGIPLVALGGGPVEDADHRDHAILVLEESGIHSPGELKRKKLAINTRRGIDQMMVAYLLKKHGLSEADVDLVEIPFPRMIGALTARTVDAAALAEPFVTLARSESNFRVVSWNYVEVRPETFVSSYFALESRFLARRDVMERFAKALGEATSLLESDPTYQHELLSRFLKLAPEVSSRVSLPRFDPVLNIPNLQETSRLMSEFGLLDSAVDAAALTPPSN